jgi:tellurite resistance protein
MNETPLSPQDALVAIMIAVSASDEAIGTVELVQIANIVESLPIFAAYQQDHLQQMGALVMTLLEKDDGLDQLFARVRRFLPQRLWETAYALACDVVAADGRITDQEARMLEEIRHELEIDRLHAAAIERGARARYQTV